MITCEVVNAANTGRPCTNPATESAELVYPSGVSETKRCCPEHAEMVRKASEAARAVIAARHAAKREESDARRERLLAARRLSRPPEEPAPPVTRAPEAPTMSEPAAEVSEPVSRGTPAPKPVRDRMSGVKKCRWCGVGKFPLCGTDRDRLRVLRKWAEEPGCVPVDFDPATSPIEPIREAWDRRAAWIRDTAAKARAAKQQEGEDALPLDVAVPEGGAITPEASGAYADGHVAGDRDRMFRCRQDLARALGVDGVEPAGWDFLIVGVRKAVNDRTLVITETEGLKRRLAAAQRERDDAVRTIAPLRADADELRALLDALRTGRTDAPIRPETRAAVDAATERLLSTVREKAGKHDDRVVVVMKFATERILDALSRLAADGRPADIGLLDALRAIATGRVPEVSGG